MMKSTLKQNDLVTIMAADAHDAKTISRLVEEGPYRTAICHDLTELKSILASPCLATILDVDSVPLDNRTIRALTRAYPSTCFLCTSWDRFHPELKEAISHHLFACLKKPVDTEELHYFLKCIHNEMSFPERR